jgi:hypothetical protein
MAKKNWFVSQFLCFGVTENPHTALPHRATHYI